MTGKMYKESELKEQGLKFFKNDALSTSVWIKKYALRAAEDGFYEELTPDDTVQRLAKEIYRNELKYNNPLSYEEIYETLKDFKYFIFGGSILFGLGNTRAVSSLGNCFFIDNEADSYGGIFNLDESMVQLMKRRGGVGITLEHLRPSLARVNNSAYTSTGAVSFMNRFSESTREVAQDGRRGALMISLDVQHPDIQQFIMIKDDLTKITGANISVKITDKFMKAVENDDDFILAWPINKNIELKQTIPYNKLIKQEDGTYVKKIKAKELWNLIIKQAHKNAEPGILFWDNIINESPADSYADFGYKTLGTNPCAEIPLSHADSCRLGSLNCLSFVEKPYTKNSTFNWEKFKKITRISQRMMDDIVDLEEEKINKIISKVQSDKESEDIKRTELNLWKKILDVIKGRRTGLGLLGLADTYAALGLTYGTKEATDFAIDIMKCIAVNSYKESILLAKERGSFDIWNAKLEENNPLIKRILKEFNEDEYNEYLKYGRRNIANTAIAPTGSLSTLTQTSSGIEPVFKIFYRRRRKINPNEDGVKIDFVDQNGDSWEEYNVIHYPFINWYSIIFNKSFDESYIYLKGLTEKEFDNLINESPYAKSESHYIDYYEKINMQGAMQMYIDHSVSVTHNLPSNISLDEVNKIYFHGWKAGCKGMTIYRDGSRSGVLLTGNESKDEDFKQHDAPKRPKELIADYYFTKANGKEYAVIVGLWDGTNKPYEIFAFENPPMNKNTRGKIVKVRKGHYKFINGEFEIENLQLVSDRKEERTLTLTASMLLRHGAPINHVIEVIKKIDEDITSFSSVVRRTLSRYIEEVKVVNGENCPQCGEKLIMQDGCVKCVAEDCGYSKCQ